MSPPTVQRIRMALENAIVDGRYQPGDRIDPDALAEEYGCSRTPVREALQALEASGMLVVQPKRGTYVARLSIAELLERFEVMAEMEALCARLAARRADPSDLALIGESLRDCEAAANAGDHDLYYTENTRFHQAIYSAAHNTYLKTETMRLQVILHPYRRRQLQAPGRISRSLAEHRLIADGIARGDAEGASRAMADHVLVQGDSIVDLIALLRRPASA